MGDEWGRVSFRLDRELIEEYAADYLPNTKYVKISFQLSFYAYLFEQLTNHKCKIGINYLILNLPIEVSKVKCSVSNNVLKIPV